MSHGEGFSLPEARPSPYLPGYQHPTFFKQIQVAVQTAQPGSRELDGPCPTECVGCCGIEVCMLLFDLVRSLAVLGVSNPYPVAQGLISDKLRNLHLSLFLY